MKLNIVVDPSVPDLSAEIAASTFKRIFGPTRGVGRVAIATVLVSAAGAQFTLNAVPDTARGLQEFAVSPGVKERFYLQVDFVLASELQRNQEPH